MIMRIGRALHRRTKDEKGFTLIELIVVIAVLGILATLAIPRVIGVKSRAETAADDANEKIIRNALERYYAEEGSYPAADADSKLPTDELKDYLDEIPTKSDKTDWTYTRESDDKYTLN